MWQIWKHNYIRVVDGMSKEIDLFPGKWTIFVDSVEALFKLVYCWQSLFP